MLKKFKIGIRFKIIAFITTFLFLIVGSLLWYLDDYLDRYIRDSITKNFQIIAETGEGSYFAFSDTLKVRSVDWSSDGQIRNLIVKILEAKNKKEQSAAAGEFGVYLNTEKMRYDPTIVLVDLLDKDGIVVASSRLDRIGLDERREEEEFRAHHFSKTIGAGFGEAFVASAVSEPDEHMDPMIHVTTRVFSQKRDLSGNLMPLDAVLLFHFIRLPELSRILSGEEQVRKGAQTGLALFDRYRTADIFMVNLDGRMITPSRFIDTLSLATQPLDTLPVRKCFDENREIAEEYVNHRGILVLGASMCIGQDNLVLVAEVESQEVFQAIATLRKVLFVGAVFTLLFGIVSISFVVRRVLGNLLNITETARRISRNDFGARAEVAASDEVGDLAGAMNGMLDNLLASRAELEKTGIELKDKEKRLEAKVVELEKFKELTVGRELKMIELKKELAEAKDKLRLVQ